MSRFRVPAAALALLLLACAGALLAGAGALAAQEEREPAVPPDMAQRVVEFYNRPGTIHLTGTTALAAGSEMVGDVAILGGPFTLGGRVQGDLLLVNGDLLLQPGAEVTGSVLLVGGVVRGLPNARIDGGVVVYAEPFRYRLEGDRIAYAGGRPEGLSAGKQFAFGRADFMLAARGGYNRVEGLPIAFGPRLELGRSNLTRFEALGIYRSATGLRVDAGRVGYSLRGEQFFGGWHTARLGLRLFSEVRAIQDMGLSDRENSLATFVLHRDYRDHYRANGFAAYLRLARRDLPWDFSLEYRDERDRTVAPHGIWAIFDEPWRPQPIVAEGTLRSASASLEYDTRNDVITPAAGWLVSGRLERGFGGSLVYPTAFTPFAALVPPIPSNPDFLSAVLDVRRYVRLGPTSRFAMRALAAGSVDGKQLPPQRQLALGGEGNLPGYRLFQFDCNAREATQQFPAGEFYPYYGCDRAILFQLEYQAALPLARRLGEWIGFRGDLGESLGWVAFYDAGRAWTDVARRSGRGGGQDDMAADAGIGLRIERIGIYWALPLSGRGQGLNLFLRIGPRL